VGYEAKLQQVRDYLARWPNLYLVGRTGSFKYMNSDGVIEDVFQFMDEAFGERSEVERLAVEEGRWV
jgi:UDP-galactopyranose mutase